MTADGGKATRVDALFDCDASPKARVPSAAARKELARRNAEMKKYPGMYDPELERDISELRRQEESAKTKQAEAQRLKDRKKFEVTTETRTGGLGLFQGKEK
jgi:hypothetical protein